VQRALHRLKATAERLRGEIEDFANECMPETWIAAHHAVPLIQLSCFVFGTLACHRPNTGLLPLRLIFHLDNRHHERHPRLTIASTDRRHRYRKAPDRTFSNAKVTSSCGLHQRDQSVTSGDR
jgi:hypothetical protein